MAVLIALCLLGSGSRAALAQDRGRTISGSTPPNQPRMSSAAGASGLGAYPAQSWGIVGYTIVNPADQPADVVALTFFRDEPNMQFARRAYVPAKARRVIQMPLRTPQAPSTGQVFDIQSLLLDPTTAPERQFERHEGVLRVEKTRPLLCILADSDDDPSLNVVLTARIKRGLGKRVMYTSPETFPELPAVLEPLEQLVICRDAPGLSAAQIAAIRDWLRTGGKLWIMLDQVPADLSARILASAWTVCEVDRIGLTTVRIESENASARSVDFEHPVEHVRVVAEGFRVLATCNGWPAALYRNVGQGHVLITTVGPRAWVTPGKIDVPGRPGEQWSFDALEVLEHAANRLWSAPTPSPTPTQAISRSLAEQIGYRIVSRGPVLATLGVFCGGVLVGGLWLVRRGRPEWVGLLTPALAVVACGTLLMLGSASRQAVPPTVATAQIIRVQSGLDEAAIDGLLGVYTQGEESTVLAGSGRSVAWPDMRGITGSGRRLVHTDVDQWQWQNLKLPSGSIRDVRVHAMTRLNSPVRAVATFNEQGLVGRVEAGPFTDLSDAVLSTDGQIFLAPRLAPDGSFVAGPADRLPAEQFVSSASGVVSDRQRRRQSVYQSMLKPAEKTMATAFAPDAASQVLSPTLYTWAAPIDAGLRLDESARRPGEALVAIPLDLTPPPAGVRLTIPAAFLPYRAVRVDGVSIATVFDNIRQSWISPLTFSATVVLRFQLPPEVLPLRVESATVNVRISAPGRTLTLLALDGEELVPLASRPSPSGRLSIELSDASTLRVDKDGGLQLVVRVGNATAADAIWGIEALDMQIVGRTSESGASPASPGPGNPDDGAE